MNTFLEIPLEKIRIGKRFRKDCGSLHALANSISQTGLLQPIIVKLEKNETYFLLAGFRRIQAHKLLGFSTIYAHVLGVNA